MHVTKHISKIGIHFHNCLSRQSKTTNQSTTNKQRRHLHSPSNTFIVHTPISRYLHSLNSNILTPS
ncbi:hypothetical protein Hanom_Chr04g00361301 [Helianthus anomalus]